MSHRRHLIYEDGLVIYQRYLYLCDSDLCAAILLLQFEEDASIEREVAHMECRDEHHLVYTYELVAEKLYSLFPYTAIHNALNLLTEKGYVSIWWHTQQEKKPLEQCFYSVDVHSAQIEQSSQPYYTKQLTYLQAGEQCDQANEREGQRVSPPRTERCLKLEYKYKTEASRVNYQLARAQELELPATLTLEQWLQTLDYFQWRCAYCHGPYALLEHFIPLAQGGGTVQANCVPACYPCNSKKGPYHPSQIPTEQGMVDAIQKVQAYLAGYGEEEV